MENRQKEIIRRYYETVVKKMNVDKVPFQLHNMKILTDEMKENLEVEHNRFAKARKLLDVITSRGSHVFTAFCMSLIEAGNNSSYTKIQTEVRITIYIPSPRVGLFAILHDLYFTYHCPLASTVGHCRG